MMTKKSKSEAPKKSKTLEHELEGGLSGAVAGAVFGAAAGPPGMAAGAIIGGVAGALVGGALDSGAAADAARTSELDEAIGVTSGEIGATNLRHPPAKRGAYSVASVNGGVADESDASPAEGGIQPPPDRG